MLVLRYHNHSLEVITHTLHSFIAGIIVIDIVKGETKSYVGGGKYNSYNHNSVAP